MRCGDIRDQLHCLFCMLNERRCPVFVARKDTSQRLSIIQFRFDLYFSLFIIFPTLRLQFSNFLRRKKQLQLICRFSFARIDLIFEYMIFKLIILLLCLIHGLSSFDFLSILRQMSIVVIRCNILTNISQPLLVLAI